MERKMSNPSLKNPSLFSGGVECVGKWGHGCAASADFHRMPGILIAHDGDGWSFAYRRPGWTMRQLAEKIAPLFTKDDMVVNFDGRLTLNADYSPHDFWIENADGDFTPNLTAYPDVIAY